MVSASESKTTMDQYVSALKSLKKSQTEKRLLQILHVIRKNISTPNSSKNLDKIEKLQKEGCVEALVDNLKDVASTSEDVINITLSTIAYTCLHSAVAKEIIQKYEVLPILCKLLESLNRDSVKGRIFRIIGNLCDGWNSNILIENSPQICKPLKSFFKDLYEEDDENPKSSAATITMALRAARKLLKKNTVLVVIIEEKIMEDIAAVFVKYSKRWIQTKQNESILEDILKVVLYYSTFPHQEVVLQLRGSTAGSALANLPELIPLNPQRILHIVMNTAKFCPYKSDLPILKIMVKLNQLALNTFETDPEKHLVYLKCLNNLLDHPGHREYVAKSGSVDVLLNLFSRHKAPSQHSVICVNFILDYFNKIPEQMLLPLFITNNIKSKPNATKTNMTNNETIDLKNATKTCRCTLKRSISDSEATSTYNFRRNCHNANCATKKLAEILDSDQKDTSTSDSDSLYCYGKNVDTFPLKSEDGAHVLQLFIAKLRWLEIKTSKVHLPDHTVVKRAISLELIDGLRLRKEYSQKSAGIYDFMKENGCGLGVYTTGDRCMSPSTSSDISSNGPYSPYRIMPKDDDSNSDDYSPICSDAEESEPPQLPEPAPNTRDYNVDSEEIVLFEDKHNKELRDSIINLCGHIKFLFNTFISQQFREKMATSELCTILLNASFRHVRPAIKLVLKIISTRSILMDFMFSNFVLEVYEFILTRHEDCDVCERAKEHCQKLLAHCTEIVNDVSFKPNLIYRITLQKRNGGLSANFIMTTIILISGNHYVKKYMDTLSICNLNLLKQILVTYEGCDILITSLRSPTIVSMNCLGKLVSTVIKIKNPRVNSFATTGVVNTISITYDFQSDYKKQEEEENKEEPIADDNSSAEAEKKATFVTFVLDDDTKIRTNRELLIEKSDYFSRLLEGGFVESNQKEIRLKNVKRRTLHFLFHLLTLDLAPPCTFTFRYLFLDTILDVILIADLYILTDIVCALTTYIEQKVLSSENVLEIYSWSLCSHTNLLRIEVVAYLMSKEVQKLRVPMLQKFIDAGLWDTLLDDIASLVTRHVQNL